MKSHLLTTVAVVAIAVGAMIALPSVSAAQAPAMGGGYSNVIPIPVDDPSVKAIAGALFKPAGAGPFPAVVYLSGCAGLGVPPEVAQEKVVIDRLMAKGVATLIVDPFTPRGETEGVCAKLTPEASLQYFSRGGKDVLAAINLLKTMPAVDPKRIFLQGYSYGAISSLAAVDSTNPASKEPKVAGLIAYYPCCWDKVDPTFRHSS